MMLYSEARKTVLSVNAGYAQVLININFRCKKISCSTTPMLNIRTRAVYAFIF